MKGGNSRMTTPTDELSRVRSGPPSDAAPSGLTFAFLALSPSGDAARVLERSRSVMEVLLSTPAYEPHQFPDWFVNAEAAEGEDMPWPSSTWVDLMSVVPCEYADPRAWSWWEARALDPTRLVI